MGQKECCYCGKSLRYKFIIDPVISVYRKKDRKINDRKFYCRNHFFDIFFKKIKEVDFGFVFCEPNYQKQGIPSNSQNFYYVPEDLKNHKFDEDDKQEVETLLNKISNDTVLWLPSGSYFSANDQPLIKNWEFQIDSLPKDRFINKLESMFNSIQIPKRGSYVINLPYKKSGIYIYYDYR
ncbi:hypothetical protein GF362_03480 [Candidatus Dojkabacteria bacterium]|nr:hypothetical protein [Candidatus Dojkabacteria bacterium]